jgi:agmatinase
MLSRVTTIDSDARWSGKGPPEYAGLLSFARAPYTEDAADLPGVDVAVLGAPMDELTSGRPGARFGPREIRAAGGWLGRHLDAEVEPLEVLKVVDFGDAPVVPSDPAASHAAIERTVGEVVDAGALPLVLGGDHSIAEPDVRAVAQRTGPLGLIHFDAHADTGKEIFGVEVSHGTPMYRLVEQGHVDGERYVQIGLRGYWPGEEEFAWQRERGITTIFMRDVLERGIRAAVEQAIEVVGPGPVFASVDVDVLDPAFAPDTGTPEPGGMTSADLLWACREVASRVELAGADVVEVSASGSGGDNITALVGGRIAFELITGVALRRAAA